jgi:hypothetical protein
MKKILILALAAVFSVALCLGQSSSTAPAQSTPNAVGHGAFPVKIGKLLDSSKLKEGDAFEVETAGSFKLPDGTLVTKGSKLEGRVTSAKARSKGDPNSELTLAFDKLNTANGKQLSIKGMVQAVFPPTEEPEGPNMSTSMTREGGGGTVGLANSKNGSNMQSSSSPQPEMEPKAVGVQGIHDLSLDNGVLTSKGKNVKLGNGVRMILHVDIFG